MRKLVVFSILIVITLFAKFSVLKCQSWDELYKQSDSCFQIEEYYKSLNLLSKALQLAEIEFGRNDTNYIKTLYLLGNVNYNLERYDTAMSLFKLDSIASEKLENGNSEFYRDVLKSLVFTYNIVELTSTKQTISELYKVISMIKDSKGENSKEFIKILENIGVLYFNKGFYHKSDSILNFVLNQYTKGDSTLKTELPGLLLKLAKISNFREKNNHADSLVRKAMTLNKRSNMLEILEYAKQLQTLSAIYQMKKQFKESDSINQEIEIILRANNLNNSSLFYEILINNLSKNLNKNNIDDAGYNESELSAFINNAILFDSISCLKLNSKIAFTYLINDYKNKAYELLLSNIKLAIKIVGKDNIIFAEQLMNLGYFYYYIRKYDSSEILLKNAQEIMQKLKKKDYSYITCLTYLSWVAWYNNDKEKYEDINEEILLIKKEIFGKNDSDIIPQLIMMGNICYSLSKLKKSENYYEIAFEICRNEYSPDDPIYLESARLLANLLNETGRYNESEKLFEELIFIMKSNFGENDKRYINNLSEFGISYLNIKSLLKAEPIILKSLELFRKNKLDDTPEYSEAMNALGTLLTMQGRNIEAEPILFESTNITRKIHGEKSEKYARSITYLAINYLSLFNKAESEKYFLIALEIFKEIYGENNQQFIKMKNDIDDFLIKMDEKIGKEETELENEEELLKKKETVSKAFGEQHQEYVESLRDLADFYFRKGEYEKSENLTLEALNIQEHLFGKEHIIFARTESFLAMMLFTQEKYNNALPYAIESTELLTKILGEKNFHVIKSSMLVCLIQYFIGNYEEANNQASFGLNLVVEMARTYFPYLSEKEKNQYWRFFRFIVEGFTSYTITINNGSPSLINLAYNANFMIKGIILNSTRKVLENIRKSNDSSLNIKLKQWLTAKGEYIKIKNNSYSYPNSNRVIDSVNSELNKIEKELTKGASQLEYLIDTTNYNWNDVRNSLLPGEASIEIVRFDKMKKIYSTDTVNYAIFIVTKDTEIGPDCIILKNGNELEGKYIELYRNQINQQRKQVYDPEKIQSSLEELYSQFWAPIQEKLKGIKTVYLSPDGVYNLLNLNTLINPASGKYILEELDLKIITSTRDVVSKSQTLTGSQSLTDNTAELFGDPQFDLDSSKYNQLASNFRSRTTREYYDLGNTLDSTTRGAIIPLPGTRKEIENIAGSFANQGWKVSKHLGSEALEEALKTVNNPRVLHIATHGKFLKDVERRNDERMMGFETQRFVENPLLRSMLLFSGAENTLLNQGQQSVTQREDGLLTAYEAQNLNLDNTELVVLSACETGLGEIKNGEGVYGLQRAFQVAGAKSLIMSLWSVSDEATQELMTSFYVKWLSGKAKREAFREAQIELKKKYPGFYYWGAFVMVGE